MSMPFEMWSSYTLHHVILWSTKTIKSTFKIHFSKTSNQLQDLIPHLFSCLSSRHHSSRYYFEVRPKKVSLMYHPSTFDQTAAGRLPVAFKVISRTAYRQRYLYQKWFPCTLWWCPSWPFMLFPCSHTVSMGYIQLFCKF